ncbi:hypothetical protein ACFL2U_03990 [Patescibacteria group bacterium]
MKKYISYVLILSFLFTPILAFAQAEEQPLATESKTELLVCDLQTEDQSCCDNTFVYKKWREMSKKEKTQALKYYGKWTLVGMGFAVSFLLAPSRGVK